MNIDIFALYIFSRYLRFLNVRVNMFNVKITFIMPFRGTNLNPCDIASFLQFANIYTRENIYVHSN